MNSVVLLFLRLHNISLSGERFYGGEQNSIFMAMVVNNVAKPALAEEQEIWDHITGEIRRLQIHGVEISEENIVCKCH